MRIRKEFIVGIVASVAIAGLILGFFFLKGRVLWEQNQSYYAIFDKANGLSASSKVLLNGVDVGTVANIGLNPSNPTKVLVKFDIEDTLVRIPLGTVAKLEADLLGTGSIALLYTDTIIMHKVGDTLMTDVQTDLQGQIDQKFEPLMVKINQLIGTADTAITVIEAIFSNNTSNLNQTFDGLKRTIDNFESVSTELDSLMITLSGSRYKISNMLTNIESVTSNLKESNEEISEILANVSELSGTLTKVDISGIANNANSALENVNVILDEIQNGDGTLTQIMQDSTLYENMVLMVDEAARLVENIQEHPNRYLQFAVFGSKDKGLNMSSKDERILKKFVKDTLREAHKKNKIKG